MPFISEEIYKNLTEDESVHLTEYPLGDKSLLNDKLVSDMKKVRQIVEMGHSKRKDANIKLRQPLAAATYSAPEQCDLELEQIIAEELNVKKVEHKNGSDIKIELDTKITPLLQAEGDARDLIRQIQQLRKDSGLTLKDKIEILAPAWPEEFEEMVLKATAAGKIEKGEELVIKKI
jgi:isoleucyl-tRNA synthetase